MGIGEEGNVEMRGVGWEFVTRESVRGGVEGGGKGEGSDQDVGEEEEGEPVGEHLLGNRLSSSEEQLGVGLGHRIVHQF